MNEPVHETLGAVARSVTAHEENGRTAFVIIATRIYATDVDDLWDALTDASRLEQWFLPVSGDLREGGDFQFAGNAGGEIRECAAPGHLVVTWSMGNDSSVLDLKLTVLDAGRTQLTLEHTGDVTHEFWDQYGPAAVGIGWDMALFGIAEHLSADPAVTSANAESWESWMLSDEGKGFSLQSGEAWREASVAGGTAPDAADRAAANVAAFYTGETAPEP